MDITFSMRKGENLARQTSTKDSVTMNLEKSAASFCKSDLDRLFVLFFSFEDTISDVYFLLALCSTTHHGVQHVLGLVGWLFWFYGISTFIGYLIPNPFLYK